MSTPLKQRWFEDYAPGEAFEFGDCLVTEEQIVDFARRFDPQTFHVDEDAAAANQTGEVVMSVDGRAILRCRP